MASRGEMGCRCMPEYQFYVSVRRYRLHRALVYGCINYSYRVPRDSTPRDPILVWVCSFYITLRVLPQYALSQLSNMQRSLRKDTLCTSLQLHSCCIHCFISLVHPNTLSFREKTFFIQPGFTYQFYVIHFYFLHSPGRNCLLCLLLFYSPCLDHTINKNLANVFRTSVN